MIDSINILSRTTAMPDIVSFFKSCISQLPSGIRCLVFLIWAFVHLDPLCVRIVNDLVRLR